MSWILSWWLPWVYFGDDVLGLDWNCIWRWSYPFLVLALEYIGGLKIDLHLVQTREISPCMGCVSCIVSNGEMVSGMYINCWTRLILSVEVTLHSRVSLMYP